MRDKYTYVIVVPNRTDDRHVTVQGGDENSVRGSGQHAPQRFPGDPDAADELVLAADELVVEAVT